MWTLLLDWAYGEFGNRDQGNGIHARHECKSFMQIFGPRMKERCSWKDEGRMEEKMFLLLILIHHNNQPSSGVEASNHLAFFGMYALFL